ncbi:MAG: hypothetical protein R2824_13950 [Saprospiraceae bacterium]|nr:hypothetical protein [Lewinella sp.]
MSPIKKYLLPGAFLALLFFHGLDACIGFVSEPQLRERRALAERPKLDINNLDPFPKAYEAYYNDHFNWRNYFIRASTFLNYHAFRNSALPDKVIVGKDGWLFRSGFQMEMYSGRYRFSKEELAAIQTELEYRQQTVEASGARYYLIIPPMKAQLYGDFLPETYARRINSETCAEQLIRHLREHSTVQVIDLIQPLKALQKTTDRKLFLQTDHHWTDYAGVYSVQVIIDELRRDFPALQPIQADQYDFATVTYEGLSLAEMLGLENELPETLEVLKRHTGFTARNGTCPYPIPTGFPFPEEYCILKQTEQPGLPKMMMVRESFANPMIQVLGDAFRESIFLFDSWKHQLHEDIVTREKPDIYIQMIWEGMIYKLLDDQPEQADW